MSAFDPSSASPHPDAPPVDPHRIDDVVAHFAAAAGDEPPEGLFDRRPVFAAVSESVTARPGWHFPLADQEEAIARAVYVAHHRRPAALLSGCPGVGKTHVLGCVADELVRDGMPVLALDLAAADADSLVDQAAVRVGLAPEDNEAPLVRLRRLRRWVEGQLAAGGLVVVADHLDLADPSARLVLDRLLAQCDGATHSPTLLAAATTGCDAASLPNWMRRHAGLRVELSAPSPEEMAQLIADGLREALPVDDGPRFTAAAVAAIHDISGGSIRAACEIGRTALLAGLAERATMIDETLVAAVVPHLHRPAA